MAFRLVKLITSETLLADTYHVCELAEQIKVVEKQEQKSFEFIFKDENLIFLINPLELIYRLTDDGSLTTILSHFMPHAEDIIFPIPQQKIVAIGFPNKGILKSYFSFLSENPKQSDKSDAMKETLLSKDICVSEVEKIISIFNDMDEKKTIKQ